MAQPKFKTTKPEDLAARFHAIYEEEAQGDTNPPRERKPWKETAPTAQAVLIRTWARLQQEYD
jgi:hypothetical protein